MTAYPKTHGVRASARRQMKTESKSPGLFLRDPGFFIYRQSYNTWLPPPPGPCGWNWVTPC